MCAGKKQQKQETVTVVTASTMQYLTQHPEQKGTQKGYFCFVCLSVVNSCRETPGPIPNPEAKPAHADGTATGRLWESKSPPTPNNKNTTKYNKEEDGIPPPSSFCVLPALPAGGRPHLQSQEYGTRASAERSVTQ